MASQITFEQAKQLVEDGMMTKKAFAAMVEDGRLKVFKFRPQTNKPEVVQTVHNALIGHIEKNAFALYEAGFKPSIVWNAIKDDVPAEEEGTTEG